MAKLKPINQIMQDAKEGDLVRLVGAADFEKASFVHMRCGEYEVDPSENLMYLSSTYPKMSDIDMLNARTGMLDNRAGLQQKEDLFEHQQKKVYVTSKKVHGYEILRRAKNN
jgi:hypothetical protein